MIPHAQTSSLLPALYLFLFFFNDTATTEIYTLSLHDALPIYVEPRAFDSFCPVRNVTRKYPPTLLIHGTKDTDVPYELSEQMAKELAAKRVEHQFRSEEHTSELQSLTNLVCRLLLAKKKPPSV